MTKPQTFDEWFCEKGYAKDESGYARSIWQAAMENAARICEVPLDSVRLRIGEFPRQSAIDIRAALDDRAEAIREAAKR
mgnify:CR=1 FL=1